MQRPKCREEAIQSATCQIPHTSRLENPQFIILHDVLSPQIYTMSSNTDMFYWFFSWAVTWVSGACCWSQTVLYLREIYIQLLLYVSGTTIYNAYFHPLAKFPGPKLYAISHLPIMVSLLTGRLPYTLKELNEKYGDVVRVAPDDLVFSSAAAAKDMYGRTGLQKSGRAYNTPPNGTDSILTVSPSIRLRFGD